METVVVIIDEVERRQLVGTTLGDLRLEFPNCWLMRDDVIEVRFASHLLDIDHVYTLHKQGDNKNSEHKYSTQIIHC